LNLGSELGDDDITSCRLFGLCPANSIYGGFLSNTFGALVQEGCRKATLFANRHRSQPEVERYESTALCYVADIAERTGGTERLDATNRRKNTLSFFFADGESQEMAK
jgi:hypothetical protein